MSERTKQTEPEPTAYLKPAEYGRHVGKSRAWIFAAIADGRVKAVRLHGALRVPRSELERNAEAVR